MKTSKQATRKQAKEPSDIAFQAICDKLESKKLELIEVVLENRHSRKKELVTTFTLYYQDNRKNITSEKVNMIDEQYLWLSCLLSEKFPDTLVIDARRFKPGEKETE